MKKFNLTLILFLFLNGVYSQNPLVKQWDYRYGGTNFEEVQTLRQTTDGGFIIAGNSFSNINGDKTEPIWDTCLTCVYRGDYWILKIDSLGIKQWDKDLGGANGDILTTSQQTFDGGYIFGGWSQSMVSGNKTEPIWDTCLGCTYRGDYWIIKTDSFCNKQWDKDFGGTNGDYLSSLQQTSDRGYILAGNSYSGISGNKTQANRDTLFPFTPDYWIIKIDSLGNKQWDRDFGTTGADNLYSVQQTADGGYILGGVSNSGISGDKTQPSWGDYDYWIIKIDSLGSIQWDKDFRGNRNDYFYSLQQTIDGGFILGGSSRSGISGNKTQANWDTSELTSDYWIVKIDSLGNKQWDRDFGGIDDEDEFGNISQTSDGGYLLAGTSYSNVSGNKTENNLGAEQIWIIKTDSLGGETWDKTIFTTGHDERGFSFQLPDKCYIIVNRTDAGIGGYKTQATWGSYDYWIIKFCDTTLTTNLTPALSKGEGVAIAPNPFTSEISITLQNQNINQATISIKNILGQTVFLKELKTPGKETKVDLSFLERGIYLVEVNADGERTVKKIVKE